MSITDEGWAILAGAGVFEPLLLTEPGLVGSAGTDAGSGSAQVIS